MRLSEVKGERTFEVIADIVDPVANIMQDDSISQAVRREKTPDGMTSAQLFMKRMRTMVPALMRDHRDDVVAILASIGGTTPDEYLDGCSLATLTGDIYELVTDEEFLGFLSSARRGAESGISSESTEE